ADFAVISAIAELSPDGREFYITFTVEEGPIYDFGPIDLVSRVPELPTEELEGLVTTEEGDRYNADEIENTIQAITDRLGNLGYAFVDVDPIQTPDREAQIVSITY